MNLTVAQRERYGRSILLPQVGVRGQVRLKRGRVCVVGLGGLGSSAAYYLAASGVGTLGLVDGDKVDLSNLQRQILHFTDDLGRDKTASAAGKLQALNPDVKLRTHTLRLDGRNAGRILAAYDVVLDCTDNLAAKFLLADACHARRKPVVHAGVREFTGEALTVIPGRTACYRCVFEAPPANYRQPAGVIGPVPGVLGAVQALEAIRYLLGSGDLLVNRLLVYDAWRAGFRAVPVARNRRCPLCGRGGGLARQTRKGAR